jgi:phosphinothricin acetyltransferase
VSAPGFEEALVAGARIVPMLLRLATFDDGPELARIYAPSVIERATSFELEPPDGAEMARRVAKMIQRFPWLVCEDHGRLAGYAYAGPHRERPAYAWSVEVSAYVDSARHRAGVGRALYTSLFAVLARQGFRSAYAGITLPNPASVGFHEAMGFTSIGVFRAVGYKQGRWHDVAWLQRPLGPHQADPPPPRAVAELLPEPGWPEALRAGAHLLDGHGR